MEEWTTAAGIAATAITLSNVIVWAWGTGWTPQQKAAAGGVSALAVFVLGIVLFPQEWSDSGKAFTILFQAVITVLASAGAPVFKEVVKPGAVQPPAPPEQPALDFGVKQETVETTGRTWGVWSR